METKHTPGPWYSKCRDGSDKGLIYEESTGKNIAVAYDQKDASLIAAAPELLEALQQIADADYGTDTPKLRATARAALAQGEPHEG